MHTPTAPQFQIHNAGWATEEPDYCTRCTRCTWSWQPGEEDDPLSSRQAAGRFARSAHPSCLAKPTHPTEVLPLAA
jgi:hypothetical protein